MRAVLWMLTKDLLLIAAIVIVFKYVLGVHIQSGNNMYPAIRDGDLILTYKLEEPIKTDVIVYNANGKEYVGRLIAKEGDTVEVTEEGELKINGVVSTEEIFYATEFANNTIAYPYKVPKDCYFILNDFRSDITDSRKFGAISIDDVKGKALYVIRRRGF